MKKNYQKRLDKLSQQLHLQQDQKSNHTSSDDSSRCVQPDSPFDTSKQKNKTASNLPNHSTVAAPFIEKAFIEDLKAVTNHVAVNNGELENPDEIEGLDQILALPQPLREIALVKEICLGYKKRVKKKLIFQTTAINALTGGNLSSDGFSKLPELSIWQELPSVAANINNRN